MKSVLFINIFCLLFSVSNAQKINVATLRLIYPTNLTYDTLIVTNSKGDVVEENFKLKRGGEIIKSYLLKADSLTNIPFSIYFGGSMAHVNDSLSFIGHRKDLIVQLKDSFVLGNNVLFTLKNVWNREDLINRYIKNYGLHRAEYWSIIKKDPDFTFSLRQYILKSGFDFIKRNLNNPYAIDVFSNFVINPRSYTSFSEADSFYTKYLKPTIKDPGTRLFVENRIDLLKRSIVEGNKAPVFSELDINHQRISNKSVAGKNVLIVFWATWCVPCMAEVPSLKEIHDKYKNDNFEMISVSLDHDSLKMISTIKEKKMDWLHIYNAPRLSDEFLINPIPASFLIDEKGIIIFNSFSRESGYDLSELKKILKEKLGH